MKALLLNGPPGSGKDTVGRFLQNHVPGVVLWKFAAPIQEFMRVNFNIRMDEVAKDSPHPGLFGKTPRQVAIRYSEGFAKPLWGQDYFGHVAVQRIREFELYRQKLVVFTDSGFVAEAIPLLAALGKESVLQVRLSRIGYSYQGDSRSTWDHKDIPFIDFENSSSDLRELENRVISDLIPDIKKWATQ